MLNFCFDCASVVCFVSHLASYFLRLHLDWRIGLGILLIFAAVVKETPLFG